MSANNTTSTPRRVLSGMRPTGKLHLGNYMGALRNWVELQHEYECFFFIADFHALTTEYADPSNIQTSVQDVAMDFLAGGLDPEKSTIFVQSDVPQHAELHLLLSMITPLSWLERVPTYKDQIEELKEKDLNTYGFLGYPLLQSADILLYRPQFVPVGQDQVPHVEITREIARRFNFLYPAGESDVLPEPKVLVTASPKLPGTDGRKMSKSYGNTIMLTDPEADVRKKLKTMVTDPARVRRTDAGNPEVCPVGDLHKVFSGDETRLKVWEGCTTAGIGCIECKGWAADGIVSVLNPIQERRKQYEQNPQLVKDILAAGAVRAATSAEDAASASSNEAEVNEDFKDVNEDDLLPDTTTELPNVLDAEGEAAAVQSPDPLTVEEEAARLDEAAAQKAAPVIAHAKPETGLSAEQKADAAKAEAKKKERDEASQSPFSVTVGAVYDGPLDLLLDLIRKQDIDIYDIPIARVTKQFLAYVENLKGTDVDSAADFIYTASLLIHIKSKMLLPRDPSDVAGGEAEDPRRELVERLLEHEKFKSAAQMLMQKQQVEEATWTNPGMREFRDAPGTEAEFTADTMDLARVFTEVLTRLRERPVLNVDEESVTVAQMLDYVKRRMVMEDKPISLRKLLHSTHSERALICMFLALLEMVRLQAVLLRQVDSFGDILIKKSDGFDAVVAEQAQIRDDWK